MAQVIRVTAAAAGRQIDRPRPSSSSSSSSSAAAAAAAAAADGYGEEEEEGEEAAAAAAAVLPGDTGDTGSSRATQQLLTGTEQPGKIRQCYLVTFEETGKSSSSRSSTRQQQQLTGESEQQGLTGIMCLTEAADAAAISHWQLQNQ
jgi:hypothetical protein